MDHHHKSHVELKSIEIPTFEYSNQNQKEILKLSLSATVHCLSGCGIGEVAGMIISTALGLNNLHSILLSVTLGFIAGILLGILPLKKYGFNLSKALKTVIIGEGLSIVVMEAFEIITELAIPGVMSAHLTDAIFWIGMIAALVVGFIAAFPVNYIFIKRGIRHQH
jgi:putative flippase GtrA